MPKQNDECERCGAPLPDRDPDPAPPEAGPRLVCPACEGEGPGRGAGGSAQRAAVLISVGLFVLAISVLADLLAFGSAAGFGWQQIAGLGLALVLVLTGAMMRIPAIAIIGLIVGVLALLADWLAFGSAEGFGWQQILGVALGAALAAGGVFSTRVRQGRQLAGKTP